jgi:hypothetical protein
MATYYNYAERSADSQVNWAEVGKGISDMLKDEVKIREEKKSAYDKAYQDDMQELANNPQGKWQDGNEVVNNFAHDMMEQQLIDYRLLKSGQMKERDYTLRRQNYKSQTNTLFELQKILQAERQSTIEQYQAGEIQGMNISNMADGEAYTNFSKSKAIIDPYAANINMGIYETEMVDGKEVRVLKKSTPVNVLKGQLLQKIPTFKVDAAIAKDVDALGVDYDFIYDAASKTKEGTITSLIGYGALAGEYAKKDKKGNPLYPEFADSVKKMDDAIEQTINKYFANPYNISSVLTENTGKYNAESYVWNKEEAAKDKTKLLKKVNPLTGLTILDEDAPHYKEQVNEAREWVKKKILSQLDSKREIKAIGTVPYGPQPQRPSPYEIERSDKRKAANNVAQNLVFALTGNANESSAGTKYLSAITGNLFTKTKDGFNFIDEEGNEQNYKFRADGNLANPTKFAKSFIGTIVSKLNKDGKNAVSEDDVMQAFVRNLPKGARLNEVDVASGFEGQEQQQPFSMKSGFFQTPAFSSANTSGVGAKYNK